MALTPSINLSLINISSVSTTLLAETAAAAVSSTQPSNAEALDTVRYVVQKVCVPVVVLLGVVGNILNMMVLTRRSMMNSTNCYLTALAAFDTLYLVFSLTLSFQHYDSFDSVTLMNTSKQLNRALLRYHQHPRRWLNFGRPCLLALLFPPVEKWIQKSPSCVVVTVGMAGALPPVQLWATLPPVHMWVVLPPVQLWVTLPPAHLWVTLLPVWLRVDLPPAQLWVALLPVQLWMALLPAQLWMTLLPVQLFVALSPVQLFAKLT
ncbi:hypothetical protein ACOMHN_011113 [Nucella lapillus]